MRSLSLLCLEPDLDEAIRLNQAALAADPKAAEVELNAGNVLFLKGDLDGAKAAYLVAKDRAGGGGTFQPSPSAIASSRYLLPLSGR